jgi:hypothetical protein
MLLRARAIRNPTWAKGVEPLVFRAGIFQNESDLISHFNTTRSELWLCYGRLQIFS